MEIFWKLFFSHFKRKEFHIPDANLKDIYGFDKSMLSFYKTDMFMQGVGIMYTFLGRSFHK
ncbi:MAG: hypothetical protein LUD15_05105, partial [Bacteroides sp.]|nr:hypothetical protein [Bacteroides sp.]